MREEGKIRAHLELTQWQISEIRAALDEADAGDFATEEEVEAVKKKWSRGTSQLSASLATISRPRRK